MTTLYGIKSCDTCRKALKWLEEQGIDHHFHDLRTDGLDEAALDQWIEALGWEALLNRRSTTWRHLDAGDKDGIDGPGARRLMMAHPTLIKRPVFALKSGPAVGFTEETRARLIPS